MDPSHYKAFLFDVDKTLTDTKKIISKHTASTLEKLAAVGFETGVCTGRHTLMIKDWVFPIFPSTSRHIVSGGAQIVGSASDVFWEKLIPYEKVQELIRLAQEKDLRIDIQDAEAYYGTKDSASDWGTSDSSKIEIRSIQQLPNVDIPIVTIYDIDDASSQRIQNVEGCSVKRLKNYQNRWYVDVTAQGVTKALGVQQWCSMQGIKPEEVIGFGDSENDLEFLETVGYAVAMGNATDEVKAIADEVTDDCDHDGVATWIEKNIVFVNPV